VEYGLLEGAAVDRFVSDLVGSRLIIAVSRVEGRIDDVWVTDSPEEELQFSRTTRSWSSAIGMVANGAPANELSA
jgi:hypothetical protein